jgi:hypothetical protein
VSPITKIHFVYDLVLLLIFFINETLEVIFRNYTLFCIFLFFVNKIYYFIVKGKEVSCSHRVSPKLFLWSRKRLSMTNQGDTSQLGPTSVMPHAMSAGHSPEPTIVISSSHLYKTSLQLSLLSTVLTERLVGLQFFCFKI